MAVWVESGAQGNAEKGVKTGLKFICFLLSLPAKSKAVLPLRVNKIQILSLSLNGQGRGNNPCPLCIPGGCVWPEWCELLCAAPFLPVLCLSLGTTPLAAMGQG